MQENPIAVTEEAIKEALKVSDLTSQYTATGVQSVLKYGRLVQVSIELTPASLSHGEELVARLPKTARQMYMSFGMNNTQSVTCVLQNVIGQDYAQLIVYYMGGGTPARIDATFTYISE